VQLIRPRATVEGSMTWLPFGDPSRARRLLKVAGWLAGLALLTAVLELLGADVRGWLSSLWDTLTEIPLEYLVAGWALQTVQTTLTALGWYFILRAGFPEAPVLYRAVLAAYAAGVALNGFLPANIGTLVTLLMFVAIIPRASFAGVLGGMVVQKIFFTVAGASVYAYLFLSVEGSFELQLKASTTTPCWSGRWWPAPGCWCSCSRACSGSGSRASGARPGRAGRSSLARVTTRCASRCPRSAPGRRSSG
jgi:hypothetical protein